MGTYLTEFIHRFSRRDLEDRLLDRLLGACIWGFLVLVAKIATG